MKMNHVISVINVAFSNKISLAKQRIGTKRHRVCLDLPEEVLPKSETNNEEAEYGKKSRFTTLHRTMQRVSRCVML